MIKARKTAELYKNELKDRHVKDNFYCYTRGVMLVCITNVSRRIFEAHLTGLEYKAGSSICSIFDPKKFLKVGLNGSVDVKSEYGEVLVYLPCDHSYFKL